MVMSRGQCARRRATSISQSGGSRNHKSHSQRAKSDSTLATLRASSLQRLVQARDTSASSSARRAACFQSREGSLQRRWRCSMARPASFLVASISFTAIRCRVLHASSLHIPTSDAIYSASMATTRSSTCLEIGATSRAASIRRGT